MFHPEKLEKCEVKFIDAFRGDLELPEVIPSWLWGGVHQTTHSCLKLKRKGQGSEMGISEKNPGSLATIADSPVGHEDVTNGIRPPSPVDFQAGTRRTPE